MRIDARACAALSALLLAVAVSAHAADIVIVNNDVVGEGFNDTTAVSPVGINPETTLGGQRMFAVQYVADIWGALLDSPVTIEVETQWLELECSSGSGVLGSAGPATAHGNFGNAPLADTWYPAALADSLTGADLSQGDPEIVMNINVTLDDGSSDCLGGATWYYGLDGNRPPGTVDIVSLVLHELGHGLGFVTFVDNSDGSLLNELPDVYLRNLRDTETGKDWDAMNDAERQASAINDPNVVWTGPDVTAMAPAFVSQSAAFSNGFLRTHAPDELAPGSSISHWAQGSWTLLMEPSLSGALFDQVDLTIDLLRDIGWRTTEDVIFSDGFESAP